MTAMLKAVTNRRSYRWARSHLVVTQAALRTALDRDLRAHRREIVTNLDTPAIPSRQRKVLGTVWGVTMVKNEADIIEASLRHQLAQGLTGIVVADNGSTDGTLDIIDELRRTLPVHLVHDRLVAYYQAQKMTNLAQLARRLGADWVLPFDADEFWFARGATVAEFLRGSDAGYTYAEIHNAYPASGADGWVDASTCLRFDETASTFRKVAFRVHPLSQLTIGNHHVITPGQRSQGLFVVHVPWRSFQQFRQKVTQGKVALDSTDLPLNDGGHWRLLGGLQGDDALRAEWTKLLAGESSHDTSWRPVGPFREERVLGWSTWDAGQIGH